MTVYPQPALPLPPGWVEAFGDYVIRGLAARMQHSAPKRPELAQYMSVAEAAEYLRCKRNRVYDLVAQKRVPSYRDGTRVLLKRDELDRYLASK